MDQLTFDMNDGETLSENIIDTLNNIIEEVCKKRDIDKKYIKVYDLNEHKKPKNQGLDSLSDETIKNELGNNSSRNKSFSVWILEPLMLEAEFKEVKSDRCFKLTRISNSKSSRIEVEYLYQRKDCIKKPEDAVERIYTSSIKDKETGEKFTRKLFCHKFDVNSTTLVPYLTEIIDFTVTNYQPSDKFGCCSKYVACSDALKCLHSNNFYARCCWYRKNLEAGRIFYGKNKNNE